MLWRFFQTVHISHRKKIAHSWFRVIAHYVCIFFFEFFMLLIFSLMQFFCVFIVLAVIRIRLNYYTQKDKGQKIRRSDEWWAVMNFLKKYRYSLSFHLPGEICWIPDIFSLCHPTLIHIIRIPDTASRIMFCLPVVGMVTWMMTRVTSFAYVIWIRIHFYPDPHQPPYGSGYKSGSCCRGKKIGLKEKEIFCSWKISYFLFVFSFTILIVKN